MAASETYIQMWLKLGKEKRPISQAIFDALVVFDNFLKENPESIEVVRKARIDMTQIIQATGGRRLMNYQYIIIEAEAIVDYANYIKGKPLMLKKKFWLLDDENSYPQKGDKL